VHRVEPRGLGGKLPLQGRDLIFLRELVGLLLHLVEEHRGKQMIGDRLDLAVGTVDHQFGIDFRDFLRDQSVLLSARRVSLVAEGHRPQLHQLVARVAHVVDVALVACRGWQDADLS
jgi:hypothetical protein